MIGYLARDKNGDLYLHNEKPELDYELQAYYSNKYDSISNNLFPEFAKITYENSPIKVKFDIELV